MTWLDGIIYSMDMTLGKLQEMVRYTGKPGMLQSMGSQESDTTEQLNNKKDTTKNYKN